MSADPNSPAESKQREGRDIPASEPDVREELIHGDDEGGNGPDASVQRGNAAAGGDGAAPVADNPATRD